MRRSTTLPGGRSNYRGAVIDRTSTFILLSPDGATHITPIHIEHSVQFPMPVDVVRPGLAY